MQYLKTATNFQFSCRLLLLTKKEISAKWGIYCNQKSQNRSAEKKVPCKTLPIWHQTTKINMNECPLGESPALKDCSASILHEVKHVYNSLIWCRENCRSKYVSDCCCSPLMSQESDQARNGENVIIFGMSFPDLCPALIESISISMSFVWRIILHPSNPLP